MIIKTDYGEYDDCNSESMLNYCCKIRGNPLELIDRTIYEFNWFIDATQYNPILRKDISEYSKRELLWIYNSYKLWTDDTEDSCLVKWCRMFLDYCTEVYCNNRTFEHYRDDLFSQNDKSHEHYHISFDIDYEKTVSEEEVLEFVHDVTKEISYCSRVKDVEWSIT